MRRLKEIGKHQGKTVSALVREAIERTYFSESPPLEWREMLARAAGSWRRSAAEPRPEAIVRELRDASNREDRWT